MLNSSEHEIYRAHVGIRTFIIRLNATSEMELIYSHCIIRLLIMTLASTVFKKSSFQKKIHLNALGSKFDLDVK